MESIISKCGYICSDCAWSKFTRQRTSKTDWEDYSQHVKKYVGFKPVKYEWGGCVGCRTPTEKFPKEIHYGYLKNCHVRACVDYNEIESCAYCSRFPCANGFKGFTKESVSKKIQEEISDSDYKKYIRMFDCATTLQELRKTIPIDKSKEPKLMKFTTSIRNPSDQVSVTSQKQFFNSLFNLFTSELGVKDADTFAGVEIIKRKLDPIARILWVMGMYGEINGTIARVDSITLSLQKKSSKIPVHQESWKAFIHIFTKFGLKSKLELMTDEKTLNTPIGYMRDKIPKTDKPSYYLTMTIDTKLHNKDFLETLHKYTTHLHETSGNRAYSKFNELQL